MKRSRVLSRPCPMMGTGGGLTHGISVSPMALHGHRLFSRGGGENASKSEVPPKEALGEGLNLGSQRGGKGGDKKMFLHN